MTPLHPLRTAMLDAPPFPAGTVRLVGAGPGDPGLLTLHALRSMEQADVVLHDALVSAEVLELIPRATRRLAVGKRGYSAAVPQAETTRELIRQARAGHRVVRLKGGDPFVFGRGGEEASALVAAGIEVRVIPGITAGLAGLSYAAVPATDRRTNSAVVFAAGHPAADSPGDPHWRALAALGVPVVIYMGLTRLSAIARELLAGGLSAATPVLIVSDATTPRQRTLQTRLQSAAADARAAGLKTPAMVAIGDNVGLREHLYRGLAGPRAGLAAPPPSPGAGAVL